jgi:hypothetical protein
MLQKPFGFDVLLRLVERPAEPFQTKVYDKSSTTSRVSVSSQSEFNLGQDRSRDGRFSTVDEDPNRFGISFQLISSYP